MERAKPVAHRSCSGVAVEERPVSGAGASCTEIGSARSGESGNDNFSGASRFGMPAARSGSLVEHGLSALTVSSLAGVPIGGAATVCACTPHIGAAANALLAQPSEITHATKVLSRTNQTRRKQFAEDMPSSQYRSAGSVPRVSSRTTRGGWRAFPG